MKATKSSAVHFDDFFNEVFEVEENADTTIAEIKKVYAKWYTENGIKEASDRRLSNWFVDNAERIGLHRSENITRNGKRVRGYRGLKIKPEWKNLSIII